MMTYDDLLERRNYIGSSDVSTILGLNPYKKPIDLWYEKTGRVEPDPASSDAALLGSLLEEPLCEFFSIKNGVTVERGHAFTHPEHDFMRAQVDGFIPDWNAHLEIKTAGLLNPRYDYSDWGDANTDQIPFQYLVQCQFALMCSGKEVVHLLAQLGCGRVTPYRIERHDELNTQILERCLAFWDAVQGNYAPSDETPSLDTLTRITRQSGESVTVDEQFPDEWEALKAQEAAIKAAIDHKKAEILHAMGEAQIGTTTVGNFYATDNSGRPRFRFKGI